MNDRQKLLEKAASHVDGAWLLLNLPIRGLIAMPPPTLAHDWPVTRATLEAALRRGGWAR